MRAAPAMPYQKVPAPAALAGWASLKQRVAPVPAALAGWANSVQKAAPVSIPAVQRARARKVAQTCQAPASEAVGQAWEAIAQPGCLERREAGSAVYHTLQTLIARWKVWEARSAWKQALHSRDSLLSQEKVVFHRNYIAC